MALPAMRIFHFSDDLDIELFTPRAVRVAAERPPESEWLNGPLVWAIDELHQSMYLFPRECPRILVWPTPETTPEDRERFMGDRSYRVIAHIERAWLDRLESGSLYRYEFPEAPFEDLHDAGMWVSRAPVAPMAVEKLCDLPAALRTQEVELRVMDSLAPLKGMWKTSLHVSGIRLRNVEGG